MVLPIEQKDIDFRGRAVPDTLIKFAELDAHNFRFHPQKLGPRSGEMREVAKGVQVGERRKTRRTQPRG